MITKIDCTPYQMVKEKNWNDEIGDKGTTKLVK